MNKVKQRKTRAIQNKKQERQKKKKKKECEEIKVNVLKLEKLYNV